MKNSTHTIKFTLLQSMAVVAVFFVLGFLLVWMGRNHGADAINKRPMAPGMLDFPILACSTPVTPKAKPGTVSWNSIGKMVTKIGALDNPGFYQKLVCTLDMTVSYFTKEKGAGSVKKSAPDNCEPTSYGIH